MAIQGTSVGLDVHALSVVAHGIDEETGKIARARLCPDYGEVLGWLGQLRAPVRVTYEAGPTGFSNSASYQGLLTCASSVCLTSFHLGLSHFALHFLAVPVSGLDVPGCLLDDLNA